MEKKTFIDWMNANCDYRDFGGEFNNSQRCKRVTFNDGSSVSIQAGYSTYCSPRRAFESKNNIDFNFYYEFELGFPSEEMAEIMPYAEQPEIPTKTVYGYVPDEVIHALVEAHGGINFGDEK